MSWVQTFSGRCVDLDDPDPAAIDFVADASQALSRIVRFNGHTKAPYSVAQHCALGAAYLMRQGAPDELALRFLLHDAHEAYIGDIATPVAAAVCRFGSLNGCKARLDRAIWLAATGAEFDGLLIVQGVEDIDLRLLRAERDQLCAPPPLPWSGAVEQAAPLPVVVNPWRAVDARAYWLDLLADLTGRREFRLEAL